MYIRRILYLAIFALMLTTPATSQENVFHELSSEEISDLSQFYQDNSTVPLHKYYSQSNEYKSEYPIYSYNLALKCRRIVLKMNTDNMVSTNGTETVINYMFDQIEKDNNEIQKEIFILKKGNSSFAGMEWLSLAERDFHESEYYLSISQDHYDDSNTTLDALTKSNFAIYKTRNLLNLAESKNKFSPEINSIQITTEGEKVASKWIQMAYDSLSLLTESGKKRDIITYSEDNLDVAKQYYSEENYYLAAMKAAEVKALAEFEIKDEKFATSEDAILYADNQMEHTSKSLSILHNDQEIDAPIATLHFETAKIRLEESKSKDSTSSIPLADTSIRNSLIAKEQANAVLDLKNAIENAGESSQKSGYEQIPWGISPLAAILVVHLLVRRRKS